jgi:DNA-binding response OmpR family regulator
VPIVAMTANAMAGDRDHCLAVGMDDDMSKPLGIDRLLPALQTEARHVRSALEEACPGRSSAAKLPHARTSIAPVLSLSPSVVLLRLRRYPE